MWQPDGWAPTRIGVLTPERDVCPEAEFRAMGGAAVSIHAARVRQKTYDPSEGADRTIAHDRVRAFADPPQVDDAVEALAAAPLHAIAYCFTSSSYVRGAADDDALKLRLEIQTHGIPVVITAAAAVAALSVLGVQRFALFSPPWFSADLVQQGARYFVSQGFEVLQSSPIGLPSDPQAIRPSDLYEWIRMRVSDRAEAVLIGGNGLRAVGVINALEEALNRPVLTANQVAFWQALLLTGTDVSIVNYGQILKVKRPMPRP
jgi:maleate isomerase